MSSHGSAGSGFLPSFPARVLAGSFLATLLALPVPALASAQESELPTLAFPRRGELTMLVPVTGDGSPGGRLSYQHRLTLRASASASALLLPAPLSNTFGGAIGAAYALDLGPVLVEPFAEIGGARIDARIEDVAYDVWRGGELSRVQKYRAVNGVSVLVGGGVSLSAVLARRLATRLAVGWWRAGTGGVDVGGLRVGLSVGMTGPDRRWYDHTTDRTPPRAMVAGRDTVDGYSIEVEGARPGGAVDRGTVRVLADDASGVREIRVAGEVVPFEPLDRIVARRLDLGEGAVVGTLALEVPPGGRVVPVVVRDSGDQVFREWVHVVGPADETAPALEVLPQPVPDQPRPLVRVWATDAAGIADARIGACPVRPVPSVSGAEGEQGGWMVGGTAPGLDSVEVIVRDQAGNAARVTAPVPSVPAEALGSRPSLRGLSAVTGRGVAGRRSIRVSGLVTDPRGRGVVAVWVDGRRTALQDRNGIVSFDGWLVTTGSPRAVTVEALTIDGRRVRERVSTTTADPGSGRLHAVIVVPDGTTPGIAELRERIPEDRLTVVAGPDLSLSAVETALFSFGRGITNDDVALVHMAGTLMAPGAQRDDEAGNAPPDPNRRDPRLVYHTGSLGLDDLGYRVSAVRGSATLVSTAFRTTRSWGADPFLAPGALPPPGCITSDPERRAGVVDLADATPARLAEGLAGEADLDGDGRILVGELAEWLGVASADGLLPYDPFVVVVGEVQP